MEFGGINGNSVERWRLEIKKTFNLPSDAIIPKDSERSDRTIRYFLIGRSVTKEQLEEYVKNYFDKNNYFGRRLIKMILEF